MHEWFSVLLSPSCSDSIFLISLSISQKAWRCMDFRYNMGCLFSLWCPFLWGRRGFASPSVNTCESYRLFSVSSSSLSEMHSSIWKMLLHQRVNLYKLKILERSITKPLQKQPPLTNPSMWGSGSLCSEYFHSERGLPVNASLQNV